MLRMDLLLRPVRRQDLLALTGLLEQLGYPTTESDLDGRLDYWLEDPASWLIGAEDGGALVGVAALHVLPILEKTGKFGRLLALVVEERYRGRGVGRMLVTAVEDQARAVGCLAIELNSSRHRTETHTFYQRLGYEDACVEKARFYKSLTDA
ncbi:GNAT family N-acetyltransferase [Actinoplanes rectilineatus]|uniref:GNAT family N-acetyltransferase n=1 Tax=Actinoplanes rectilineatus TaxID=113571 RepID=UPI00316AC06A